MRFVLIALACSTGLFAVAPKLSYTRSFPGSTPDYFCVGLDRSGAIEYKESPTDDQPLKAQLPDAQVTELFAMAEKLNYFKTPLESGLKVANTGKKTLRYEDGNGPGNEVTFNYSVNEVAQQLQDKFEQIGASERAYIELDRTVHYDRLGVNDALAEVETLWLHKQLAAPKQFVPLLTRITNRETLMHLVRDRAARLKEEFEAAPDYAPDPKQK
ncbi:MAG: hypothetical protein JO051_04160 [Acidobacteriaceae bacterium]|nr:hypothetical protein [Acidobacteriaceae bacterium]